MARFIIYLFCLCAFAQEGPKPSLSARELYYIAAKGPSEPRLPPSAGKVVATNHSDGTATGSKGRTAVHPIDIPAEGTLVQDARLVKPGTGISTSAPPPASGTPLGLKYTLLKLVDRHFEETPADTEFRTGDHIQLHVETNGPGYLRILNLGPIGNWNTLFPSPKDGGSGHVEGFRTYTIQSKFDEPAGTEKLFLIFTREVETEVPTTIASIDNRIVSQLRTRIARDLIVEPVGPSIPGSENKESAVYVVNPTGSSDSRLVADLLLIHK